MFSFSEPNHTPYDLRFRLGKVPVRVHPLHWLGSLIFGWNGSGGDLRVLLLWMLAVFISILVHEMGHALAILHYGGQPHVELVMFGGLAIHSPTYRTSRAALQIAAAGPIAGFLLAAAIIVPLELAGYYAPFSIPFWPQDWPDLSNPEGKFIENEFLFVFVWDMLYVNILWGLFNLLPVIPLDGSTVCREILRKFHPSEATIWSLYISMGVGAAVAFWASQNGQTYMAIFMAMLTFESFQLFQGHGGRFRGPRW